MNTELKAVISVILDAMQTGKLIVDHENFMKDILPTLSQLEKDIMSAVTNWDDFKNELKSLIPGSPEEKDLLDFIESKCPGSEKAKKILDCSLKLILDTLYDLVNLSNVIKGD